MLKTKAYTFVGVTHISKLQFTRFDAGLGTNTDVDEVIMSFVITTTNNKMSHRNLSQ